MSAAIKKQDTPPKSGVQQHQQIRVDRNAVDNASRLTSGTINQMTDQIAREIAREVEKKQQ
jgi:hypothetical protein